MSAQLFCCRRQRVSEQQRETMYLRPLPVNPDDVVQPDGVWNGLLDLCEVAEW